MSSPIPCTDPAVRADYNALFSAAQDAIEHLNKKQKNQLTAWTISDVFATDLYTHDSFVEPSQGQHSSSEIEFVLNDSMVLLQINRDGAVSSSLGR
ncbi:hypothetical protein K1719_013541 [Acacia pycnantha]|nr:hypothetical protein K1719_013541 [Acacia pycnantha]